MVHLLATGPPLSVLLRTSNLLQGVPIRLPDVGTCRSLRRAVPIAYRTRLYERSSEPETQVPRYHESWQGCAIDVVTERVDAIGIEPMRRVKTVLVTRNGVKLDYRAPPYAGPDEDEIVHRAFKEARAFVSSK